MIFEAHSASQANACAAQDEGPVHRIRLTRKLALSLNGFDLSRVHIGDVLLLPDSVASMLIAEGWAEAVPEPPALPNQSLPQEQRSTVPRRR